MSKLRTNAIENLNNTNSIDISDIEIKQESYINLGDYATVTSPVNYNNTVTVDGTAYRLKTSTVAPYSINGNWEVDASAFVPIGDAVLRQELAGPGGGSMIGLPGGGQVERKLSDVVTPADFLAAGDGTTDDRDAISDFIAAVGGSGVTVLPLNRTYNLVTDTPIQLPSNTILIGKFKWPGTRTTSAFEAVRADRVGLIYCDLDGGYVGGDGDYNSCHALVVRGCTNVLFSQNNAKNIRGDAVYLGCPTDDQTVPCVGVWANENKLHNCTRNGIALVSTKRAWVQRNEITSDAVGSWCVSAAIDIEPNNDSAVFEDIWIEENIVKVAGCIQPIRSLCGIGKDPGVFRNIHIDRNEVDGMGIAAPAIALDGGNTLTGASVNGNTVRNGPVGSGRGIQVYKCAGHISTDDNDVQGYYEPIIGLSNAGGAYSICGNTVVGANSGVRGIHFRTPTGAITDVRVERNDVTVSSGSESILVSGGGAIGDVQLNHNRARGGAEGINATGCDSATVIGNNVDVLGSFSSVVTLARTGNIIGGVSDEFSRSVTVNPPNLAAGANTTITLSIGGASLGSGVVVIPPYSLQGILAFAWVDAAGSVNLFLENKTAAPIDLASSSWVFRFFRA